MSGYASGKEITRQGTIDVTHRQALMDDSGSPDIVLQGLMVDDSELKRILKGDVLEPLNELGEYVTLFDKGKLLEHKDAQAILNLLEKINARIAKFQRLLPYQFLLSPLMRLTNSSQKEVDILKLRVSLMIDRDLLDIEEDTLEMTDVNFYEALEIMCHNAIQDSLMGNKIRALVEQRKVVKTTIEEEHPRGKGFLSRFHI